ncbi:MAG TPA: ATP-binding cassette domain-containing protein [Streptosporangiaceae bacterium]|nr:ATP-binding cassette domain-containing protein [Streptosporangiaceae bacterium]
MSQVMIEVEALTKRYGETQALAGVDFSVQAGTLLGLLGPNGAGKTTAVRVLTTLALPDSGRAAVAGIDVVRHPAQVRRHIGVAAQDATLDRLLTGRQNLVLVGELSGMGRQLARARATDLLEQFELTGAADRVVDGYSGGMRRRLDVAASLISRPPLTSPAPYILFLDEPTTGLDPASRQRVWEAVRQLLAEGVTVLLTTQYLDEADALADRIVVIDSGRVVADDTPKELKEASRGARLEVTLTAPSTDAVATVAPLVSGPVQVSDDGRRLSAGVDPVPGLATSIIRALDQAGIAVDNVEVRQPSLDDVFFALTGGRHHGDRTRDEPESGHGAGQAAEGARA